MVSLMMYDDSVGYIIDCAFTIAFDPQFDELLMASKEATMAAIKEAGVDARLGELGGLIEEVITSHEVEINGITYPIQPVRNLSGHTMAKGTIHAGKSVPLCRDESSVKMEEGEIYAIETFASTGQGMVMENGETSHFAVNPNGYANLRMQNSRKLLNHIHKTFGTLPFCPRWLVREDGGSFAINGNNGQQKLYHGALRNLVEQGVVRDYPPLCDQRGSYVSQWEHTLLLKYGLDSIFIVGQIQRKFSLLVQITNYCLFFIQIIHEYPASLLDKGIWLDRRTIIPCGVCTMQTAILCICT